MAAKIIAGVVGNTGHDFARNTLTGAETIAASVGAGQIAIVIDSGVNSGNSSAVHTLVRDLLSEFMENEFVET